MFLLQNSQTRVDAPGCNFHSSICLHGAEQRCAYITIMDKEWIVKKLWDSFDVSGSDNMSRHTSVDDEFGIIPKLPARSRSMPCTI